MLSSKTQSSQYPHGALTTAAETSDPYWNNVIAQYSFDGRNNDNGAARDLGPNGLSFTEMTYRPYFSKFSPFDTTSWFFNGTTDYITVTSNAALNLGTSDFTIQCWVMVDIDGSATGAGSAIVSSSSATTDTNYFAITYTSAMKIAFVNGTSGTITGATTITKGVWHHVAVTRSGTTVKIYLDGVLDATATSTLNTFTQRDVVLGAIRLTAAATFLAGNLYQVHIEKSVLYTGNFTPSAANITPTANTVLLFPQLNETRELAAGLTLTRTGTPVQSPVVPASASTLGINGSSVFNSTSYPGYFRTTTSALTPASSLTTALTVEAWVYPTALTSSGALINHGYSTGYTIPFRLGYFASNTNNAGTLPGFGFFNGTSWNEAISPTALPLNTWSHIAGTYDGTTLKFYVDGVLVGSYNRVVTSFSISVSTFFIVGTSHASIPFEGYYAYPRVSIGAVDFTGAFARPTAPPSVTANTAMYLDFANGGGATGAGSAKLGMSLGTTTYITGQDRFNKTALVTDGTVTGYARSSKSYDLRLGTADFTIEFWMKSLTSASGTMMMVDFRPPSTNGAYPMIYISAGSLSFAHTSTIRISSAAGAVSNNTWHHIAVVRISGVTKMYIDGVQTGSSYTDNTSYLGGGTLIIGNMAFLPTTGYGVPGMIDDVRITKGVGRYTTTFTPPSKPYFTA